jgi:hypothetical protein
MGYSVRQVISEEARGILPALLRANLHLDGRAEDKLRWCYEETPAGPGTAFVLEHGAGQGGAVAPVGCVGLAHLRFYARGEPLEAFQMIDLAVDRRHRTLFPSRALQRAARAHARAAADFAYGFPNQRAAGMLVSLGYRRVGTTCRYARPLRFRPLLERRKAPPLVALAGGLLADGGDALWQWGRARAAGRGGRLTFDAEPGPAHEALWRRGRDSYAIVADRSAAALAWRLRQTRGAPMTVASLRRPDSDEVLAWALIDTRDDVAHLRDLFAAERRDLGDLLDLLLPELRAGGAASVSFCFAGSSLIPALLQARGFRPRAEQRAVLVDPGERSRLPEALLGNPEAWYLTDYDEPG